MRCCEAHARNTLPASLRENLLRWMREVPMYQRRHDSLPANGEPSTDFFGRLPFITKRDIRNGFPKNFLRDGVELEE